MGQEKTFTRKNFGTLYKWSVRTGPQGKSKTKPTPITGCKVGYVYNRVIVNGQAENQPYVECGYVQ